MDRRFPSSLAGARSVAPLILWLLGAATLPGCSGFDLLNGMVPRSGYARKNDIAYGSQPRQSLDLYRPAPSQSSHTRSIRNGSTTTPTTTESPNPPARGAPVVVFLYGGSWTSGSKSDYRFVAHALTSAGFMAVLPDYRLYPSVTFPAFVEDGAAAIRWTRDNAARFGGDPERIYLMGHSAGAHIAALLTLDERYLRAAGVDSSVIRATAVLSGPYDFVPGPDTRGAFRMSAGDATPDPNIQPINFVDGAEPPMLLIHGRKDNVVDPADTLKLAASIRQAGGSARTIIYSSRGHPGTAIALAKPFRYLAPVLRDVRTFFDQHGHNVVDGHTAVAR